MENIVMNDNAIKHIIQNYTSEQGVRELKREITAVLRRELLENNCEDIKTEFTPEKIDKLLSLRKSATMAKKIGFGIRA
jgi:ATP-dependent Lon protease